MSPGERRWVIEGVSPSWRAVGGPRWFRTMCHRLCGVRVSERKNNPKFKSPVVNSSNESIAGPSLEVMECPDYLQHRNVLWILRKEGIQLCFLRRNDMIRQAMHYKVHGFDVETYGLWVEFTRYHVDSGTYDKVALRWAKLEVLRSL